MCCPIKSRSGPVHCCFVQQVRPTAVCMPMPYHHNCRCLLTSSMPSFLGAVGQSALALQPVAFCKGRHHAHWSDLASMVSSTWASSASPNATGAVSLGHLARPSHQGLGQAL